MSIKLSFASYLRWLVLSCCCCLLTACGNMYHARIEVLDTGGEQQEREAMDLLRGLAEQERLRCDGSSHVGEVDGPTFVECNRTGEFARMTVERALGHLTVEVQEMGGTREPQTFRSLFANVTDEMTLRFGDSQVQVTYPL